MTDMTRRTLLAASAAAPAAAIAGDALAASPTAAGNARAIPPRGGRDIAFPLHETRAVVERGDLPSGMTMFDIALDPRTPGTPPHRHESEDEIYVVYEGAMTFLADDVVHTVPEGGAVSLPRGGWHAWWNEGDTPVRAMCVISHDTEFDQFFDQVVASLSRLPDAGMPQVMEVLGATAAEHGLEIDMTRLPERAHALYGV
jgi:quercetin dioxygenase-like cupin family protein